MTYARDLRQTTCNISMSALATRYVYATIRAKAGTTPISSSSITVDMAFMLRDSRPSSTDWQPASLVNYNDEVIASVLVGPAGLTGALSVASYGIWVRVVEGSEIDIEKIGSLTIT